jgi:hypothetical protein
VGRAVKFGEIAPDPDLESESEQIIAMVNGLGAHAMFAPDISFANDSRDP